MSRLTKILGVLILAVVAIAVVMTMLYKQAQSPATSEEYLGGQWDHGASGGVVWSSFSNEDNWHYAWVQGKTEKASDCVAPGEIARVTVDAKTFGRNDFAAGYCEKGQTDLSRP
ncbi:MAG: lactococcin 972 family bacteriocin [Corynebacterium sp.]|nr:lactococcin 972 family bacteriocin [Corynebacterium sp.]